MTSTTATTTTTIPPTIPVKAIVTHESTTPQVPDFRLESLDLSTALGDDELLVEITATGICHTDIVHACTPGAGDQVLGHEGAGIVKAVGRNVTKAKVGDMVGCSYVSCRECIQCTTGHYGHCVDFLKLNFSGVTTPFARPAASPPTPIRGSFFGQSSFATHTVVSATSILNLTPLLASPADLATVAPLGCGLLTGYAAITNVARALPRDRLIITGLGGVGLAAVMAAKLAGCARVIAVDRVPSRLALARRLGATHTIDTSAGFDALPADVATITDGLGASFAVDTTGVPGLIHATLESLTTGGEQILIGVAPPEATIAVSPFALMATARTLRGSLMGDCDPAVLLPEIIAHWRAGRFPFDELIRQYRPDEFQQAVQDMHSGVTVKPVIVWG